MRLNAYVENFGMFEGCEKLRERICSGCAPSTERLLGVREASEGAGHD